MSGTQAAATFLHGVASGDPTPDGVVLWTRVNGADVDWVVAVDPELRRVVSSGTARSDPDADHTVHVDVTGLEAGTTYYYGFSALGSSSPVGRTRTLPGADASSLRLATVSCAKYNAGFFNGYARIADRDDLDFVVHLGDYIYEAAQNPPASQTPAADIGRVVDPLHECVTLADYRRRYGHYRLDPDVQRLHAAHPVVATLDDHELADGAWRDGSVEHRSDSGDPWSARRARAFRARWEWLPARPPDPDDRERVFRTVRVGDLADLIVVETRSRRDEPVPPPAMNEPGRTALGAEQRDWLLAELASSRATWRLLATPSVLSHTWSEALPPPARRALAEVKLIDKTGAGPDFDQWDGYPAERDLILRRLAEDGIGDVVVLSGDVHISLALEVRRDPFDPASPSLAVEFTTASLTSQNVDDKMHWPPRTESVAIEAAVVEALPHLAWCELDSNGYVVVDVSPARVVAEWWHVDTVLRPSTVERCAARWSVARGAARLTAEPTTTAPG